MGGADFSGCRFAGPATSFAGSYFGGKGANFSQATFTGKRLSFRRMRAAGQVFSFKRSRVACGETSFDEAQIEAKLVTFVQAHITGERVTLNNIRCDSDVFSLEKLQLECAQWEIERSVLKCQGIIADGLQASVNIFSVRDSTFNALQVSWEEASIEGEQVDLEGSQFHASTINFARGRWSASQMVNWRRVRFTGDTVDMEASLFAAPTIDMGYLNVEAKQFRFGGSRFEAGRLHLNSWRLDTDDADLADMSLESGEADLSHWRWTGKELSLDRLEAATNETTFSNAHFSGARYSLSHADFQGGIYSLQNSYFAVDDVRFSDNHFGGDRTLIRRNTFMGPMHMDGASFTGQEIVLWHNQFRGQTASLRQARFPTQGTWIAEDASKIQFSGASVARVDFSGSTWERHGGRYRCLDEMVARDGESLLEASDLYRQLKEAHLRAGERHKAGDFLIGEMECYRRLAGGSQLRRLSWLLWFLSRSCGYFERPWRTAGWCALLFMVVIVLNLALASPFILWPFKLPSIETVEYFSLHPNTLLPALGSLILTFGLALTGYVFRRSKSRPLDTSVFRRSVPGLSRRSHAMKKPLSLESSKDQPPDDDTYASA